MYSPDWEILQDNEYLHFQRGWQFITEGEDEDGDLLLYPPRRDNESASGGVYDYQFRVEYPMAEFQRRFDKRVLL